MFNFFKKKTPFESYYYKFISRSAVKSSEYHKPITAAYLYILSDYNYSDDYNKRRENANSVFAFLENIGLSNKEMDVFDKAVDLFGQVIRKEVISRGDWCFFNGENDNALINIFLCYGDLINNPACVDDYEGAPIMLTSFDAQILFAADLNDKILSWTSEYIKSL